MPVKTDSAVTDLPFSSVFTAMTFSHFFSLSMYCPNNISVIPKLFLLAYHFELLYSVCVPPKLQLTRMSQTKKHTSVYKKN